MTDESVFAAALAIPDPDGRAAYLDRVCAGKPDLRREVEELLAADAAPGPFLAAPPLTGLYRSPEPDATGTRVGPYKLLQKIGEGGMGAVYMADQEEPVKRRVALKVIKPGMDSKAVLARFEAERQALALMEHPNIARVLDAGTTPDGRPYFAMELVKGVPITRFCDDNKLNPRDRLDLFVSVCQAIQHAHQKGIIHRDVKPTNVLVTLYDGKPVPKVIDFGIAKATAQRLTEKTLFTEFGALVGTPEYMAPEQAELNALDVDTRADIYSLGVLLYELLTGTTPLDRQKVRQAGYAEMLRLIREVEAERPSARLTARREALAAVSAQRHTDPGKLTRLVRGELDWIVMKSLEKDRSRRYETANGFARDIQRFLADEPVEACPPSAAYRLRKLLSRHRRAVAVLAGAGLLVLSAGLFAYRSAQLEEQRLAEKQGHDEQLLAEKRQNALEKAMLMAMGGDLESANKAIAAAELLDASTGQVRLLRGQVAYYRQEGTEAIDHLEQAVQLLPESVAARALLATAYVMNMERGRSEQVLRELDRLSPVTPEDFLFKGLAESFHNPPTALRTLDEATRRRDMTSTHSTVARAIRGGVYTRLALDSGDVAAAEQAVEHVTVVKAMMPDNPFPLVSSLYTHLVAAQLLGEAGHEERRKAVLAQAERDARAMERFSTHHNVGFWRYNYLLYLGQEDAAFEAVSRISEQTKSHGVVYAYALALYRRGEYKRAAEFLERRKAEPGKTQTFHVIRGFVLAELPDGLSRALEAYKDAAALEQGGEGFSRQTILLLLGRKGEAVVACRERRQKATPPPAGRDWMLDYACELISADELLQAAGSSRSRRSLAHFRIALHHLADGDRAGARDHFGRCVATNFLFTAPNNWSKAFLARMEKDPNWPPWIPQKN